MGARECRDEERPAGETEELNDAGQHADGRRDGDELEPIERQHLAEEHGGRSEQDGGEHEAVPDELQPQPAGVEPAQDDPGGAAQDGGVVEEPAEQEEQDVEGDR